MLNKAMIIGRLGKDPERRDLQNGMMATMTIATDEGYTGRDGNRVEATEWHKVVAHGKTAEICCQYLGKGSLVYVEGRIRTRKWVDQSGMERQTKEIHADRVRFLDRRQQEAPAPQPQTQQDRLDDYDEVPF